MNKILGIVICWLVGIGLAILLGIVIWHVGWDVTAANMDRQNQVNNNSQQMQSGIISQEQNDVAGWYAAVDLGQKSFLKQKICANYLNINHPPNDLVAAQAAICN